jgi:hypothetical protein
MRLGAQLTLHLREATKASVAPPVADLGGYSRASRGAQDGVLEFEVIPSRWIFFKG